MRQETSTGVCQDSGNVFVTDPSLHTEQMKSTKVQNPRRITAVSCVLCQCACAEIGHAYTVDFSSIETFRIPCPCCLVRNSYGNVLALTENGTRKVSTQLKSAVHALSARAAAAGGCLVRNYTHAHYL